MTTPRRRAARPFSRPLALLLALGLTACSSDDGGDEQPSAAPSSSRESQAPPEVRTTVSLERVPGKLPADVRKRVRQQVGEVVDRWFDAAYVGGRYPRTDFHDAFPGFTTGARAQAHHDKALMSNQAIGRKVDSVRATQRLVWIDVLPAGGRAAAATARFRLEFTTTGKVEKDVAVRGRLFLTPGPNGWRVFGYDVDQGSPSELAPPEQGSSGKSSKQSRGSHDKRDRKGGGQ